LSTPAAAARCSPPRLLRPHRLPHHHDGRNRRRAGTSKGAPYLYFPGKEPLYVAQHGQWDCALSTLIDAATANMPDHERRSPRRILHTVVTAAGADVTKDPQTRRVLMAARILAA
jgi:AcrR family transcriptional regulator